MKLKKRYIVACVLLCIAAVALSVAVFNFEMGLASFSKLNKVTSGTWYATSGRDPETGVNTDLFVNSVSEASDDSAFPYIGYQASLHGKCVVYNREYYADVSVNGKNPTTGEEYKIGDRLSVYYKPDDPNLLYVQTDYTIYLILIAASLAAAILLIILCRIVNKNMKDNTFSEAAVTIMDIPMAVIVAGFILAFFAGMFIGNIKVDASYTNISEGIVELLKAGELSF